MRARLLILLSLLPLLVACQSTQPEQLPAAALATAQPEWIQRPTGPNGQLGGVGVALPHIRGPHFQRETAIARALDELARQLGVTVHSVLEDRTEVAGAGKARTHTAIYSVQTTDGQVVKAALRAVWTDPRNDHLYAWMTLEQ